MFIDTLTYTRDCNWVVQNGTIVDKSEADLVLLFGHSEVICLENAFNELRQIYPNAVIAGSSSAGHILGTEIIDADIAATAVQFEKGSVKYSVVDFMSGDDVEEISRNLLEQLPKEGLKHVFVLSDGLNINGSELVRGMNKASKDIHITGGMAGDGDRFQQTWVIANDVAKEKRIVAIGFYGDGFVVGHGCYAGWSEFGSDRKVTKSEANILYELDGQPALDLYKKYLGEFADDLPNSGMRFPLSIKENKNANEVIRTLLAIDEESKSITFAGDVPEGYFARLMKPDLDVLIDGAKQAALDIKQANDATALGLVVSCTGRKIVLNQIVEEEIEMLEDVLGENMQFIGFYSYGEIAPFAENENYCQLHNQTMTVTAIYEV